jgi:hypothetical protein
MGLGAGGASWETGATARMLVSPAWVYQMTAAPTSMAAAKANSTSCSLRVMSLLSMRPYPRDSL